MTDDTDPIIGYRATLPLQHGRVIFETDNPNVIKLTISYANSPFGTPLIDFVGEGVAKYEIKFIYQPTPLSFACLISNPIFRLEVFWSEEHKSYLARLVDAGEFNTSIERLTEARRTMNALHDIYLNDAEDDSSDEIDPDDKAPTDPGSPIHSSDSWLHTIADLLGTLLGAAGRTYSS